MAPSLGLTAEVKILRRTSSLRIRERVAMSGEGESKAAAIWESVIGWPAWECMMSGMRRSMAAFRAMESMKWNMYFHTCACPWSIDSSSKLPSITSPVELNREAGDRVQDMMFQLYDLYRKFYVNRVSVGKNRIRDLRASYALYIHFTIPFGAY